MRMRKLITALVAVIGVGGSGIGLVSSTFEKIENTPPIVFVDAMPITTETTIVTTTTETTTTKTSTTETSTESVVEAENSYEEEPPYGSDAYLLAYAMSREAAYGDYTDATYVANVVLNRVDDPDFPNTVIEVLEAPNQYWGVSYYSREYIYDKEFFKIAEKLLYGERPLPSAVVYQARFPQGSGIYCTWGAHYYCYK